MGQISIDPKYKVEKVASTDISRYNIIQPYFKDGVLMATNGWAAVKVYLEKEGDQLPDGIIPKEVLQRGRRNGHGRDFFISSSKDDKMLHVNNERVWFERDTVEKYPDVEVVISQAYNISKDKIVLSINPELLFELARSMGSKNRIVMHIPYNKDRTYVTDAIYITSPNDDNVEGAIMGMRYEV